MSGARWPRTRRAAWVAGSPARSVLLLVVRAYRVSVGRLTGGRCRFHPSCSAYAEQAIGELGAVRGGALAAWRVLRCSPLSKGGVDRPPTRGRRYDAAIQRS